MYKIVCTIVHNGPVVKLPKQWCHSLLSHFLPCHCHPSLPSFYLLLLSQQSSVFENRAVNSLMCSWHWFWCIFLRHKTL